MKALLLKKAFDFDYEERPMPVPRPGEALVRIDAVSVCGSDVHAIKGNQPMFTFPRVIGHEVAATVVDPNGCASFRTGDRVCLMPCISCGSCAACKMGKPNCCAKIQLFGVHVDGGMQEYAAFPAKSLLRIDFSAQPEAISLIEPLTIGAHAVSRLELNGREPVLVLGAGPIGVCCALLARLQGAEVVLADVSAERREFVQKRFDFTVLDPLDASYAVRRGALTQEQGFYGVVDTTANKSSMDDAFRLICHGGRVVFLGLFKGTLELDEAAFHMYEPMLCTSRNSTAADFQRIVSYMREGRIDPMSLLTHTAHFSEAAEAIPRWVRQGGAVFKGVIRMEDA